MHGEADGFVEIVLRRLHLDALDDFGLGRQLVCNLFLGASQQEGFDPLGQQPAALGVALLLDRRAKRLGEAREIAEEAGQGEREDRP
jgi:hypothetical protein